jgi:hypothetical protein
LFKFLATLKTEIGVFWILKLTLWALHFCALHQWLCSLKDVEVKWMVKLNYRKYEFVSNYSRYNLLWVEFEGVFADIPYGNANITQVLIY